MSGGRGGGGSGLMIPSVGFSAGLLCGGAKFSSTGLDPFIFAAIKTTRIKDYLDGLAPLQQAIILRGMGRSEIGKKWLFFVAHLLEKSFKLSKEGTGVK